MNLFASIFAVLISFQVFAGDTSALFEELRDLPISYEQKGQICEQVARLQLDDIYPPHAYDINIGIEYIVHNRTIGELDVVVTDKQTRDVILIAEVKCWKNLKGALNKAKDQRSRFIRTLKS